MAAIRRRTGEDLRRPEALTERGARVGAVRVGFGAGGAVLLADPEGEAECDVVGAGGGAVAVPAPSSEQPMVPMVTEANRVATVTIVLSLDSTGLRLSTW